VTTGPAPSGDGTPNGDVAVELVTARDAADSAAEADKAARRAATEAERSARQAAEQATRAAKAARSVNGGGRRRWWPFGRHGSVAESDSELVTFSDLVRSHREWEKELYACEDGRPQPPDKAIEREFRRKWRQFEGKYGRIDDAYWSVRDASAVALTIKHKEANWQPEPELVPRFHRATDWATRDEADIAQALDDCETLAVRVEEILRGPSELIALRRINAVASHLLGSVDREWYRNPPPAHPRPTAANEHGPPDKTQQKDRKAFVDRQREELRRIELFYNRSGNGQARILFFWGMAQGLLALMLLTALAVGLTWLVDGLDGGRTHWGELQLFVISVIAGALGALLSVLSRMASLTGKFELNHELGRKNVRWIGIYRPFVGGIFGLATFLMLASGILQTESPGSDRDYAYFGILALFSGFFERFTKLAPTGAPIPLDDAQAPTATEKPSPT
jgi:hypothetical protein